jgi:NAD(P)-dependent dehydrogenase (short-subunit alcohol dehydrogenase family)
LKKGLAMPAALVTGGAVRLGRALALALAENGYDLALHYHSSQQAAENTAEEIRALGRQCFIFQQDLTDVAAFPALLAAAHSALPGLSVLVNSASGYIQENISETSLKTFDEMFFLNLRAPYFLTQAFCATVESGQVINIIDNKVGFHQFKYGAYLLSKKALAEFTKMAALEYAPHFRINGIAPGVVLPATTRSPEYIAWRVQGIPLQKQGHPDDISQALLFLLSSGFISGQMITVDGAENIDHVGKSAADFDQTKV